MENKMICSTFHTCIKNRKWNYNFHQIFLDEYLLTEYAIILTPSVLSSYISWKLQSNIKQKANVIIQGIYHTNLKKMKSVKPFWQIWGLWIYKSPLTKFLTSLLAYCLYLDKIKISGFQVNPTQNWIIEKLTSLPKLHAVWHNASDTNEQR